MNRTCFEPAIEHQPARTPSKLLARWPAGGCTAQYQYQPSSVLCGQLTSSAKVLNVLQGEAEIEAKPKAKGRRSHIRAQH